MSRRRVHVLYTPYSETGTMRVYLSAARAAEDLALVESGRPEESFRVREADLFEEDYPMSDPDAAQRITHVFEGEPDGRQSDDPMMATSRFRPRYRALTEDEKALHDEIKAKATELERLFERIGEGRNQYPVTQSRLPQSSPPRYLAMATTSLEESIMWAVKALTL